MLGGVRRYASDLTPWQRGAAATLLSTSIWTLLYFLFLRTPVPLGWSLRTAEIAGVFGGAAAGGLLRAISRRGWPLALGAAIRITLGGGEAYVSDTHLSLWQRVSGGFIMAPFALALWIAIIGGWAAANIGVVRWRGSTKNRVSKTTGSI